MEEAKASGAFETRANSRHHSGAMRSGPSAFTTRRVTRRHVKRTGGPSGISASTATGSGLAKRSAGRRDFSGVGCCPGRRPGKNAFRLLRALRDVTLNGEEAADDPRAKAIGEAVDEKVCLCLAIADRKRCLRRQERLGCKRSQNHDIDAETKIDSSRPCPAKADRGVLPRGLARSSRRRWRRPSRRHDRARAAPGRRHGRHG